jgi:hypothetical protein
LVGTTPYEAYKGRQPNLEHVKIFGCIAFAKTETQVQKLDNRSNILVHLGSEPGSKGYHLYDPKSRRVVVNRDVEFDETRGWKWDTNAEKHTENETEPGMFTVYWGTSVDNGTGPLNPGPAELPDNNSALNNSTSGAESSTKTNPNSSSSAGPSVSAQSSATQPTDSAQTSLNNSTSAQSDPNMSDVETEESEVDVQLRRSTRQSNLPGKYKDYELN